jgi:hypothetical protein
VKSSVVTPATVVVVVELVVVVVVGAVVVVVAVVDVVVVVDVDVVDVVVVEAVVVDVVVVGVSMRATNAPAHESTSVSSGPWFPVGGMQSLSALASSFTKQPLAGSLPPSNFAFALSMHPSVLGSVGFPTVWAFW